jgi:hypothetical protein
LLSIKPFGRLGKLQVKTSQPSSLFPPLSSLFSLSSSIGIRYGAMAETHSTPPSNRIASYAALYPPFQTLLHTLRSHSVQSHPDAPTLQEVLLEVQHYMQTTLLAIAPPDLDPALQAKLISYQTEISKELRLVGTDILFVQAAREPMKRQQRQAQLRDRLDRLIAYGDRILTLLDAADSNYE